MHLNNLLHYSYWFGQPFMARGTTFSLLVGIFLILVLIGLLAKIWRVYRVENWQKEVLRRLGNFGLTIGILGLIWLFLRQNEVFFLGLRFWLLLGFLVSVWWVYRIVWYLVARVPKIKAEIAQRAVKEKYLP